MRDLARVYAFAGKPDRAMLLCGAAEAILDSVGVPIPRAEGVLHNLLKEPKWQEVYAQGRKLTPEQAITYALDDNEDLVMAMEAGRNQ
jgi:hypothetical protein